MAFSICETVRERRRAARGCARQVLNMGANRLTLVLAEIACTAVSFFSYFAVWIGAMALYASPAGERLGEGGFFAWCVMHILFLLLFWLLAAPLWLGTYRLAICMVDGREAGGKEFFRYVSSARAYGRALGISARLILRWLPAFVGYVLMQAFWGQDLLGVLLLVLFVLTVVISLLWVGELAGFVTIALSDNSFSLRGARRFAARALEGERMCDFGFHLGTAWRMLVSLLWVGVPLMLHTLPASMLSAACYVRRRLARDDLYF